MDAGAESAAHVCSLAITVERREQAEAVDDQAVGAGDVLRGSLAVEACGTRQFGHEHVQAVAVKLVGCDDELHLAVRVEVGDDDVLVRGPGAAHDQGELGALYKLLDQRELAGGGAHVGHAVKAGVTGNDDVLDTDARQQVARLLVLDKQGVEALEHLAEHAAPETEEYLLGAENGRDDVGGDAAVLEGAQVIAPKLILDKDGHRGLDDVKEFFDIGGQVKGQIDYRLDHAEVLAHLVARGREEREQDAGIGLLALDFLDERTSLLKLSQRRGVDPDVAAGRVKFALQCAETAALPAQHQFGFGVAHSGDFHRVAVGGDTQIIDRIHGWLSVLDFLVPCPVIGLLVQ